ncbi:HxlR family transcriptional regulator [Salipiger aestuarii]|uniref:HxlR family transcriptional regulator n=1 Tax=Salipiger aestuarii TaxID=568098 RepID=A0A327Y2Y2_9RHOB|nr:helix-turn-helix domain-containing protein [Salipiger aestuarii]EIE50280.1 HxlR family transcriptional regulator [Citreicella sp. 357]KAA8606245.1 HxlR family transcriptional regulator [Salipiger aestuarii]KAA8606627.1 HxlR family transcriptional regulator [Salipiger aestuarii]KAB2541231.1 HxlR family transcriptional regulator [Salipiger aestuarii]RAK15104.1 HxlR family transcriptional regulator [Salipiger aestuarii]
MTNETHDATNKLHAPVPLAECALARAIRTIGDEWTLLILREALCGVERFDAMRDDLGIPRSVLSQRLKQLTSEGLLQRKPYSLPGQRPRDGYVLTERGRALIPALAALREWAEIHLPGGPSRLRLQDSDGQKVTTRLIKEDGSPVDDVSAIVAVAHPPNTDPA